MPNTNDTEWTPERRKEQELKREGALALLRHNAPGGEPQLSEDTLIRLVDGVLPPPPPEYTYGREVFDHVSIDTPDVRRSDGVWGFWVEGVWERHLVLTDDYIRQRAAEVPLSDVECAELRDAVLVGIQCGDVRGYVGAAYARVLRGEVKGNG